MPALFLAQAEITLEFTVRHFNFPSLPSPKEQGFNGQAQDPFPASFWTAFTKKGSGSRRVGALLLPRTKSPSLPELFQAEQALMTWLGDSCLTFLFKLFSLKIHPTTIRQQYPEGCPYSSEFIT